MEKCSKRKLVIKIDKIKYKSKKKNAKKIPHPNTFKSTNLQINIKN